MTDYVWAVTSTPATVNTGSPSLGTTVIRLFSTQEAATAYLQEFASHRTYQQLYHIERMLVEK